MRMIQDIFRSIFICAFFACTAPKEKSQFMIVQEKELYPKTALSPLFDSLRPALQSFTVRGDRDTLLVGSNGTTLAISKDTFVNSQGLSPSTIVLDILEINSLAGIVTTNLQTTSGEKILQSGGMLFIDAKEGNEPLLIKENKSIYVELRSGYKAFEMKIFDGKFDGGGSINWTAPKDLEDLLIPIPLKLLNFGFGGLECRMADKQIESITKQEFESTYIATREFEERTSLLNLSSCEQYGNLSQRLLDIYTSNIDGPLFIADSLAADFIFKNYKTQIDTLKPFEFTDTGWITFFYETFSSFTKERLTNVVNFEKLEIDENTTTQELIEKGFSEREAEKLISLFNVRKQVLRSRETEKASTRLAAYSFNINNLGWINVDRFIDDQDTQVSTFLVHVKSKEKLDYISVSLVIPAYNAAIFSIFNDANLYSFTRKNDEYRSLPVGADAIVVAFSYKENKPIFGIKKIKIPADGQIDLDLKVTNEQVIKNEIAELLEGKELP